ncbi:MAG: cupin domain-containing protein [Acidimicrobiales bacterium]
MPTVRITSPVRIEAAGNKPKLIEEHLGRASSGHTGVSVAHMHSPGGWTEPGQTPEFEEFTLVLSGRLRLHSIDGEVDVTAGHGVVVPSGQWVRYSTPDDDGAEYVSICIPAFTLETAHRDDEE